MIYMDNAATTMRKPKEVAEAVMHAMNSMGNAGRGANEASLSAARVIYDTRELLADFFDAENPKQIVFTSNSNRITQYCDQRDFESEGSCDHDNAGT